MENSEELQQSMQIIVEAGDARAFVMKALDQIGEANYLEAKKSLDFAHEKLNKAHAIQTGKIQQEAKGISVSYSVLFSHAQDTLMATSSEYNMTKHLLKIFQAKEQ